MVVVKRYQELMKKQPCVARFLFEAAKSKLKLSNMPVLTDRNRKIMSSREYSKFISLALGTGVIVKSSKTTEKEDLRTIINAYSA